MRSINNTLTAAYNGLFIRDKKLVGTYFSDPVNAIKQSYNSLDKNLTLQSYKVIEYSEAFIFLLASKTNLTQQEMKIINEYQKFIHEHVILYQTTGKLRLFNSRIFQEKMETCKKVLGPVFDECKAAFDTLYKDANKTYKEYINGERVDNRSLSGMYTFFKITLGNPKYEHARKRVFEKDLKAGKKQDYHALSFNLNYQSMLDYKEEDEFPSIYITNMATSNGLCHSGEKCIEISTRFIGQPLIKLNEDANFTKTNDEQTIHNPHGSLAVLFHEIQHERQAHQLGSNMINKTAFFILCRTLIHKYFSTSTYDEYHSNYLYKEIENQCNQIGSIKAAELSRIHNLGSTETLHQRAAYYKKKFAKGLQRNTDNEIIDTLKYNIESLSKIIKDNPHELSKYPIASRIIDRNGNIKDIRDFVKAYTKLSLDKSSKNKDNEEELYDYLFNYYVYNNDKTGTKLNLQIFDNDLDKISLLMLITNFIIFESRALKDMFDSINSNEINGSRKKALLNIAKQRANCLAKAQIFFASLKKSGELDRLMKISNDHNSPNYRHTYFSSVSDGTYIRTVTEHVKKNKDIKNELEIMLIAQELDSVGDQIIQEK